MLNLRLQTIYNLINEGMIVADIGTDHAFLPIELVSNGKCKTVYACDINEGPLKNAHENIKKHGLIESIKTIKSDGLNSLDKEVDVVVIAGMGFYSAKEILENAKERLNKFKQIIVQVNNDVSLFRKWISDNNFTIKNEKIVKVGNHFYTIIEFNTNYSKSLSEFEINYGCILLKEKSKEFLEFLEYRLKKLENIYSKLSDSNKKIEINKEISNTNKLIKELYGK